MQLISVVLLFCVAAGVYSASGSYSSGGYSGSCPQFWNLSKSGAKCYLTAPLFHLSSYFDQLTFCIAAGGKVVQPDNLAELQEVKDIAKSLAGKWTEGPWINYILPFDSNQVVSQQLEVPADAALAAELQELWAASNSNTTLRCSGFDKDGIIFSAQNCSFGANPFCERKADN